MVFLFLLITVVIALLIDFVKTRRNTIERVKESYTNSLPKKEPIIVPEFQTDQSMDTAVYRTSAHLVA